MTQPTLTSRTYTRRYDAEQVMWRHVARLQRHGIHTGALRGDNGLTAQWTDTTGRTQWATVTSTDDGQYYIQLSTEDQP